MNDDLKKKLRESIERARNWAEEGWKLSFGPNQVEVSSLTRALDLPREFPYRQEAVAYWKNVEVISEEVTVYLVGALADLENGDPKGVENKLYFAQYFEKPLEEFSHTSRPIYESLPKR